MDDGVLRCKNMKKISNDKILADAYRDFVRELSRYANIKVRNAALTDDLVQTTFMKTWLYLLKAGKIELMRAFLYRVLNHLIIDEYRRKKALSLDLLVAKGLQVAATNAENIFNAIDGKALVPLIKELPPKYRGVLTMRYAQDFSIREMSAVTHQSPRTVSVQLHRGLAKLRRLYAEAAVQHRAI